MRVAIQRVWEWLRKWGWKILFFLLAGIGPFLGYCLIKWLVKKPEIAPEPIGERIARESGKQEIWNAELKTNAERERELESMLETVRKIPVVEPATIRNLEAFDDAAIAKRFGESGL